MEKMLSNFDLDYERFEAVCPSIDQIKFGKYKKFYEKSSPRIKKYVNNETQHPRAIGIFGCYLSHLKIHQSQLDNLEPYIIFEDDVKITEDTLSQLDRITCNPAHKDWDVIRSMWDSSLEKCVKIQGVHIESAFAGQYPTHTTFGGSHFSIFNNANKIIDYISSENLMAVDSLYSTCVLNVYHQKLDVKLLPFGTDIPKIVASDPFV